MWFFVHFMCSAIFAVWSNMALIIFQCSFVPILSLCVCLGIYPSLLPPCSLLGKGWPWLPTGTKQGWSCLQLPCQSFQHHPNSSFYLESRLSTMHEKPFPDAVRIFCGFRCKTSPLCAWHSLGFVCCGGFGLGDCVLGLCVMTNVTVT